MYREVTRAGACWALLALSAFGCKSRAERLAAEEVGRISFAVDRLREAPNNAKRAPLERLEAEACSVPVACELQQICIQGYSLHLRATESTNRVREALRQRAQELEGAARLLEVSERDLSRAKGLIDRCVSLEGELARQLL